MSRPKTRRPGTKSERANTQGEMDSLRSVAEEALDDLLSSSDAPPEAPRPAPPPAPGAKKRRAATEPSAKQPRRAVSAAPLEDSQLVEETVLPEVPALQIVVCEQAEHLAAIQAAITAAGHVVVAAGPARAAAELADVVRAEPIDALICGVPGGEAVIDAALALEPRRPVVIASLDGPALVATRRAAASGADLALVRPHDLDRVAPTLLAAARLHVERLAALTARGSELVLRARLEELSDPEPRGLQPFELFQRVLELEIKRAKRFEYPLSVALFAVEIPPPPPPAGIRGILRARAGNALIHTIRDIDLATQLDHERFLVLLPYTDVGGAARLGQRVIAAVAAGDPVVSAGRSFPPRLVGAVAGGRADEPINFAKLMKDATRALEQARRDGAELAVQP